MMQECYDEVKVVDGETSDEEHQNNIHQLPSKSRSNSILDKEIVGGFRPGWQSIYETMYLTNTPHGQICNLALLILTVISVTAGMFYLYI